jgi:NADPH-dependent 2,4-dienoyl-CoA reductase/sulfur reductase-like enzyme
MSYRYVIVGGGIAGASAIEGIREHDREGSILLVSRENHPPYQRPPLSKDLWFGKLTLDKLPVHDDAFYRDNRVTLELRREIVELDPAKRTIWDDRGVAYEYEKLLLATGGRPRLLEAEINVSSGVNYYRSLEDYLGLQENLRRVQHVLVVGAGFIGTELAAAVRHAGAEVTMIYADEYPLNRVLSRELGLGVADKLREHGIETVSNDAIVSLVESGGFIQGRTRQGNTVTTQLVLVGVGIVPQVELAEAAGLEVGQRIHVNEFTGTSEPDIFAAGDCVEFPFLAIQRRTHFEHWDHSRAQGRVAGENMAGAEKPYDHIPMFWSDVFDIGWEAVGDLDTRLDMDVVWREEGREGVIFYIRDDVTRGVLLWNSWNKVEWARSIIREARPMTRAEREAAIPPPEG